MHGQPPSRCFFPAQTRKPCRCDCPGILISSTSLCDHASSIAWPRVLRGLAFTAAFRWCLWQQKALRDQRKELQDLMVAHMTGAKGISVDPDLAEKTAKVRVQWVTFLGGTQHIRACARHSERGEGVASKSSCSSAQSH